MSCIDGVCGFLDKLDGLLFYLLRDALGRLFHPASETDVGTFGSLNDFFAVMLDTNPAIAGLPLMGPINTGASRCKIFPPIFAIDTMDLFVDAGSEKYPDGSDEAG